MKEEIVRQISNYPLFEGISKQDIQEMIQCMGGFCRTYQKSEILILEKSEIKNIGLIIQGSVYIMKEDVWGNQVLITKLGPAEIFGETFVCGSVRSAKVSFIAAEDTEVLFLPFHKVIGVCNLSCVFHHRLIENMMKAVADKNVKLMEKIEVTSKKTLRDKIITYLLQEKERFGSDIFTIPMGRQELADYLCADRKAPARELSLMKKDGLLEFEKRKFHLYL